MRIAVLATKLGDFGGVQRYGKMVCEALELQGNTVYLRESADWPSALARCRGMVNFRRSLKGADLLWVLHPRLANAGLVAARSLGLPMIVSTYGFETWGAYARAWRLALSRSKVVTAVSMFSASLMGEPGRKAVLLRPTWGIAPMVEDSGNGCREEGQVLFVGRLNESYKGADVVLDLASRFRVERQWTFVLAGAGRLPVPLQAHADALPNVQVIAFPSDDRLAQLYSTSTVLIAPSRAQRISGNRWTGGEGFGIVLLEAAMAGLPVIASDEGACPETVALLGHGLVSSPTTAAFEPLLRRLLDDAELRAAFGHRGSASAQRLAPESFRDVVASVVHSARPPC